MHFLEQIMEFALCMVLAKYTMFPDTSSVLMFASKVETNRIQKPLILIFILHFMIILKVGV